MTSTPAPDEPVAIIAVGGSAGGLKTFQRFLAAMPPSTGAALVVIQHLDPTHASLLPELLRASTSMPVDEAVDGVRVERDRVYVIPPNAALTISAGRLHVSTPLDRKDRPATIDRFFRSLAEDVEHRAIGIVVTGVGTDGSDGLRFIKAHGGVAFVQTPETTPHDGMPRSAIATGVVDYVLPVEEIPRALARYLSYPYVRHAAVAPATDRNPELQAILALLRTRGGADFGHYKKGMVSRRVHRRMGLRNVAQVADYAQLLRTDPGELETLRKDLLIRVTGFFREPHAWEALRQMALDRLVAAESDVPLRAWTAGCATGEEAYSLAMMLVEAFERAGKTPRFQIFATDIDGDALAMARAARYPESIAEHVSAERLARFFVREEHQYVVSKEIRELVLLAPQNLIGDPPFSKLDVVVCRNLLIYLDPQMQQRVLSLFHFALKDGGYLFLGSAETVGQRDGLFEPLMPKERIFRRLAPDRQPVPALAGRSPEATFPSFEPPSAVRRPEPNRVASATHKLLASRFAPAAVLVDRSGEALHFSGPTDAYLTQPPGPPTRDLISLTRDRLRTKVRSVLNRAIRDDKPATDVCRGTAADGASEVRLTAEPLRAPSEVAGLVLVTFEAVPDHAEVRPVPLARVESVDERALHELEEELRLTREDLRASTEQIETSNEELKAAHEEAISTNEELQSTNEELETSKEELQSLNEELSTVNSQLEAKVSELESTRDDLQNLLTSTELATLFLDRNLRIKRFTPAMTRLMRLIATDCGRPISDFGQEIANGGLTADAKLVLRDLRPVEREVSTDAGDWYARRVLPYRTGDDRIEGVVVTFANISAQKHATSLARDAQVYAESIVDTVSDGLLVLDPDHAVISVNRSFHTIFQTTVEEVVGRPLHEIGGGGWNVPELRALIQTLPTGQAKSARLALEHEFERIGHRSIVVTARRITAEEGREGPILLAIGDVTERARLESEERSLRAEIDRSTATSIEALEQANRGLESEAAERLALEEDLQRIVDSEQRRIGQDLHDEIGQDLTAINYLVHNLRDALADGERPETAAADRISSQVVRVQERLRAVTRALVPMHLESRGVREALGSLAADLTSIYGIACEIEPDGGFDVTDPLAATNLYRIAQEAMTNALKHAEARRITVRLREVERATVLEVRDDGSGMDGSQSYPGRLGKRIMEHRARLIGGTLVIESAPVGGTVVRCSIPPRAEPSGGPP